MKIDNEHRRWTVFLSSHDISMSSGRPLRLQSVRKTFPSGIDEISYLIKSEFVLAHNEYFIVFRQAWNNILSPSEYSPA